MKLLYYLLAVIALLAAIWLPFYIESLLPNGWATTHMEWWSFPTLISLVLLGAGLGALAGRLSYLASETKTTPQ